MTFQDALRVEAPAGEVWDFLLDLERMATCLPGVQEASQDHDGGYRLVVKTKVGLLPLTMNLHGRILEIDPHKMIKSEFKGSDSRFGGGFTQVNVLELSELGPCRTEVRYSTQVAFEGMLGKFGGRVMKAAASGMIQQFNTALKTKIETAAHFRR